MSNYKNVYAFQVRAHVVVELSRWLDRGYQAAGIPSPLDANALVAYVNLGDATLIAEEIVQQAIATSNEEQARNTQLLYRRNHVGFMESRYGSAASEQQEQGIFSSLFSLVS